MMREIDRSYKVVIKQFSPDEKSILLAGPYLTEEEANEMASRLCVAIYLRPNQYLAVCEEVVYRKCKESELEACDALKKLLESDRNTFLNNYLHFALEKYDVEKILEEEM